MRHVLIINGNPDPAPERLSHALARAYHEAAAGAGAQVRQIDVGGLDFALLRNGADFLTEPKEDAIVQARGAFLAADHIVFIFPLWLGGAPALLKGFMEQVGRAYFLLGKSERGFPRGQLKGRTARVIVTMGMPTIFYRTLFGGHGVKAFTRGILKLAGIGPVRTSLFGAGQIEGKGAARTIRQVRALGGKIA